MFYDASENKNENGTVKCFAHAPCSFVQWRVAFYAAGLEEERPLHNFLLLLDDFFKFQAKKIAPRRLEIELYPHIGIDIGSIWNDLEHEPYTCEDPALKPPLGLFEAQPVNGRRVVTCHLQIESDNSLNMLLGGNTWGFRNRLDAHGVTGMYVGEDKEKQVYYRVLKDVDITDDAAKKKVLDMLGCGVFNNLAMKMVLDKDPHEEETAIYEFIKELKALPNCHFV